LPCFVGSKQAASTIDIDNAQQSGRQPDGSRKERLCIASHTRKIIQSHAATDRAKDTMEAMDEEMNKSFKNMQILLCLLWILQDETKQHLHNAAAALALDLFLVV